MCGIKIGTLTDIKWGRRPDEIGMPEGSSRSAVKRHQELDPLRHKNWPPVSQHA